MNKLEHYTVDWDRGSPEWVQEPLPTGEWVDVAEWNAMVNTEDEHYETRVRIVDGKEVKYALTIVWWD